jgi:hypothetical protein
MSQNDVQESDGLNTKKRKQSSPNDRSLHQKKQSSKRQRASNVTTNKKTKKNVLGTCSICWELMVDVKRVQFLPCSHRYHEECMKPIIKMEGVHTKCPECRGLMIQETAEERRDRELALYLQYQEMPSAIMLW